MGGRMAGRKERVEHGLILGSEVGDETSERCETFGPHTYACRPPGVAHGPFRSTQGCLLFEIHYYD